MDNIATESTSYQTDLISLQSHITPSCIGALWLSAEELSDSPWPFYALDYFFDGQLINQQYLIKNNSDNQLPLSHKTVFWGLQFGRPFPLVHFSAKDLPKPHELEDVFYLFGQSLQSLAANKPNNSLHILVISKCFSQSVLEKFIKSTFPTKFKHLQTVFFN